MILNEGEVDFLKMITQADVSIIGVGGNFFAGLTSGVFVDTDTLVQLVVGEPSAVGGYARIAFTRDATGWPTQDVINGAAHAQSELLAFTPAGADFDKAITRIFLTNVLSGTAGRAIAVSEALSVPLTLLDGVTSNFNFDLFMR